MCALNLTRLSGSSIMFSATRLPNTEGHGANMTTVFVYQSRLIISAGLLVAAPSACNDQVEDVCAQIEAAQPAS